MNHFKDIIRTTSSIRYFLLMDNVNETKLDRLIQKIVQQIEAFTIEYNKPEFSKIDFKATNKPELYFFWSTLTKFAKDPFNRSKQLRGVTDKLMTKCLNIAKPMAFFTGLQTQITTQFCMGITYFKNDTPSDERPFYHRLDSCGTATKDYIEKFSMLKTNTDEEVLVKAAHVRRCYIERRIYDIIYTRLGFDQDGGHLHEMRAMERLYDEYFPDEEIIVDVKFDDDIFPVRLNLDLRSNGRRISETYRKRKYNSKTVHATKLEMIGALNQYEKVQTFNQEEPWLQLTNYNVTNNTSL